MAAPESIERKRELWNRLSELLDKIDARGIRALSREELHELGRLHRTVSSHLAQAQSGASDEAIVAYLNRLVARSHAHIYRSRTTTSRSRVARFFASVFPAAVQQNACYVLVAAVLLFGSGALAFCVTYAQPRLARAFIGEAMARSVDPQEFSQDSPMAALSPAERTVLSSAIMGNNIRVGLISFAGGVLCAVPTVLVLVQNGFILGGLTGLYMAHGAGLPFLALVLPHGILELLAVVVAAGGGLRLGYALIAPGRLRRRDALYVAGREAVLLAVGATPLFAIAAVVEGFLTPLARLDDTLKFAIGAALGVLAVVYLVRPVSAEARAAAAGEERPRG